MKKLLFLFAFMGLLVVAAQAQSKACCAGKKADSAEKVSCSSSADAEKAASNDENIVKQVSDKGEVSYARKSVCPASGKVSFTAVEYCSKSGKFVSLESEEKASCSKNASSDGKKSCCKVGAKSKKKKKA